jgi:hypothetical protein
VNVGDTRERYPLDIFDISVCGRERNEISEVFELGGINHLGCRYNVDFRLIKVTIKPRLCLQILAGM